MIVRLTSKTVNLSKRQLKKRSKNVTHSQNCICTPQHC